MRVMKSVMAICAICGTMLVMTGMRRAKMMKKSTKRHGLRSRHR
jgi:hypothetical protein